MNTPASEWDLIIVGAGLVGASLALSLVKDSPVPLRLLLVEAGETPETYSGPEFDPRVVALTEHSRSVLAHIGVWPALVSERVCPYRAMTVWDGEGTGRIHFHAAEVHSEQLGHIVENSLIVRHLHAQLAQTPGVTLLKSARVEGLKEPEAPGALVSLTLDSGQQLCAPLIIAADGARSQVRELARFATREWDYGQRALVTTVRTERPHGHTAWQRFMRTGPLAFLPLQWRTDEGMDDHYSSIVWSADEPLADELMALDDAAFCQRLSTAFEHTLGSVEAVAERFSIPLRQRHATGYIQPGIALVGDAAHNIHPLAGQGVNLGLLDVAALSAEVVRAGQRQIPLGDISILRRYQRQRLGDNLRMMAAMEGFKRLFGNADPATLLLRNLGLRQLDSLPWIKNSIARRAMAIGTRQ